MLENLQNMPVGVLGFGRSGRAVTDFLLARGARPAVYAETPPETADAEIYARRGVTFHIGPFPAAFPRPLLVRSPGIRPDIPALRASQGVLTSETELFLSLCPAPVIGVTGSDGKTTTSSLIAALLQGGGHRVYLGGNNGRPLLPLLDEIKPTDRVVLELSSFQLMTVSKAPHTAVITNITPNHLNWHTDMAEYATAKGRIFGSETKRAVLNATCPISRGLMKGRDIPTVYFGADEKGITLQRGEKTEILPVPDTFHLPGRHNRENLSAALAAVEGDISPSCISAALAHFHGVPHRLQYVDTVRGVRYYNSSIDTSPTRTAAALSAIGCRPLVIAGGRGKGLSLTPLGDILAEKASAVFLYGETAREIEAAIAGRVPATPYGDLASAFRAAAMAARPGDTVLLSPGCTAFDQFRDFEHRGDTFCRLVEEFK